MAAPQGWYDAGVPGRQRWWDGMQWSAHERDAPAAVLSMGWYTVPGTADIRWWDGAVWTPYRLRDGRPKPDAIAIEPPSVGLTLGLLFFVIALVQLSLAFVARSAGNFITPVLFMLVAVIWITGSWHSQAVRKLPAPQSAPVVHPVVQPLPGEVEGPGAGWYPMTGQVTRWWTGVRWTWYIGQKFGPRPGHAGPRGYLVSMILGWCVAGLAVVGLLAAIVGAAANLGPAGGFLVAMGVISAVVFGGLAVLVLLLTRSRRNAMLLPTTPPPLR